MPAGWREPLSSGRERPGGGLGLDGGLAEYLLVARRRGCSSRSETSTPPAAPLTDAALTPYHAINASLPLLTPGSTTVVIGVGGLGHVAVQILRALRPTRIVAIDAARDGRRVARRRRGRGARRTRPRPRRPSGRSIGRYGATLVLDFVAADQTLQLAAGVAANGGAIVYVGRGGGTLGVTAFAVPFETSITVPTWGTIPELAEVVALARAGTIHMETQPYALSAAVDAYGELADGRVVGRAVATP